MKFLLNYKKDKKPLLHNKLLIILRIFLRKNISNHLFLYMPCEFPFKKLNGGERNFFFLILTNKNVQSTCYFIFSHSWSIKYKFQRYAITWIRHLIYK